MDTIDYDSVADIYDLYVDADYDFDFFGNEIRPGIRVLELIKNNTRRYIERSTKRPLIRPPDLENVNSFF